MLYSPREIRAYFKTSYYRPTRQQSLGHTVKLVKQIPFREPSLLYVKRHKFTYPRYTQRPNQRIKSAPNPMKKPKYPKIIPHQSQDPNFFHVKWGGLPHHISHQAAHRSPNKAQSVVVIGVLLRRTPVLIRMGLLGLSLQGTISSHVCQPSRSTTHWR